MSRSILLFFLTFYTLTTSYGQKQELPPAGSKYPLNKECSYSRQTGRFDISRNEAAHQYIYQTDSMRMIVVDTIGAAWMRRKGQQWLDSTSIYLPLDSITRLLFQNGLLTPDLLLSAFNKTLKYLDHKGDTTVITKHTNATRMTLNTINERVFAKKFKVKIKKRELRLSISVVFEDDPFAIYVFDLHLSGKQKPSPYKLAAYFKTAEIKCMRYAGFEI
jgi:hypothetical protein